MPEAVNFTSTSFSLGGSSSSSITSQSLPASHITAARVFTSGTPPELRSVARTLPAVALEDQTEADEGQVRLVLGDGLALAEQERRKTTGRDDDRLSAQLVGDAPHDAVDLAGEPEDDARLERLDGRLADDRPRPDQLDLQQPRGPGGEGVDGDLDPRRERAAEELALSADDVEVGRRTEVDDDRRPAVQGVRRQSVDDAVRADLAGVVVEDRDAGADSRLDDDGRHVGVVAVEHSAQLVENRGDGGAGCDPGGQRLVDQQAPQQERDLVSGRPAVGLDPP